MPGTWHVCAVSEWQRMDAGCSTTRPCTAVAAARTRQTRATITTRSRRPEGSGGGAFPADGEPSLCGGVPQAVHRFGCFFHPRGVSVASRARARRSYIAAESAPARPLREMNGLMLAGSRDVHAAHEAVCTRYPAECDQLAYDAAAALLIGTSATCFGLVYAGSAATTGTYVADGVAALVSDAMGAVTTAMAAASAGVAAVASAAAEHPDVAADTATGLVDLLFSLSWHWEWRLWPFHDRQPTEKNGIATSVEAIGNSFRLLTERATAQRKRTRRVLRCAGRCAVALCSLAFMLAFTGGRLLLHLINQPGPWPRELERDCA